ETQFLENINGDALTQFNQPEQQVLGSNEIVVEAVGLFARQREHLLRPGCEIIHRFIAHNYLKLQHFHCLSNPAPGGSDSLAIGRLTGLSRSRTMSARSRSRSSAESFSECCFCRCAGWVRMKSSSTRARSTPGNNPTSTPNRI